MCPASSTPGARSRASAGAPSTARSSRSTSPASRRSRSGWRRGAGAAPRSSSPRISAVFAELIAVAERHGGDVLKFRGDALLLFFAGDRHVERACGAASDMQWTIEAVGSSESSVGPVELRMSAGVHSGACHFFLTAVPAPRAARGRAGRDAGLRARGSRERRRDRGQRRDGRAASTPTWLGEEREGARLMTGSSRARARSSRPRPPRRATSTEFVPDLAARPPRGRERRGRAPPGDGRVREGRGDGRAARARGPGRCSATARRARGCGRPRLRRLRASPGSSRTSTSARSSSTSRPAPLRPRATTRRGCCGRCARSSPPTSALPLRAGVNRGHVFTGDIGADTRRTYAVMGDAVNLAARLTARAQPGDVLATRRRPRARAHRVSRPRSSRCSSRARSRRSWRSASLRADRPTRPGQPPDHERRSSAARPSSSVLAARRRTPRGCGSCGRRDRRRARDRASHGSCRSFAALALGFQQLDGAGEHYATVGAVQRGAAACCAGSSGSARHAGARGGRHDARAVRQRCMPDLAPWLPLLAVPFDAEVPATAEVDRARRRHEPRPAAPGRRDVPRAAS